MSIERKKKLRIDQLLVEYGLAVSQDKAQRMVMAGEVLIAEQVVNKPSQLVAADATIRVRKALPYASRGGLKLAAALQEFQLPVEKRIAIDVGSSTGGFTDCLLQNLAQRVFAIDVGYGLLAWSLRQDPRVEVLERTNIRHLKQLPIDANGRSPEADLAVIDTSFISLKIVLPATLKLLEDSADIIALIKPQFEASKTEVGKGGVVQDIKIHERILKETIVLTQKLNLQFAGLTISPVLGPAGNVEFLLWMKRHAKDKKDKLLNETQIEALIHSTLEKAKKLRQSKQTELNN